jgi:hypothetical protein
MLFHLCDPFIGKSLKYCFPGIYTQSIPVNIFFFSEMSDRNDHRDRILAFGGGGFVCPGGGVDVEARVVWEVWIVGIVWVVWIVFPSLIGEG